MSNIAEYPDFIGGTDQDDIERAFAHIAKSLTTCDADFMFGAGMSRDNVAPAEKQMPLGKDVAVKLLGHFFPAEGDNPPSEERLLELVGEYPLEAVAEAVEKVFGTRGRLTSALEEILHDEAFDVGQAHRDFHAICNWDGTPRLSLFFTTNFDQLFRKTFGDQAVHIPEKDAGNIRKVQKGGKIAIIDLHGNFDSDYRITESDVFDKEYKILHGEFRNALHTAEAFVFVGYSMSDPDFRRIYMEYRQEIASRDEAEKMTYFVAPCKDGFSYRLGTVIWKNRGAVWIPFDSAEFFAALRRFLERREDKRVREAILKKYNLAPEDDEAYQDLVKRTAEILRIERSEAVQFLYAARTKVGGGDD